MNFEVIILFLEVYFIKITMLNKENYMTKMSYRVVIFKDIEKKYFNMTKLSLN